ERARRVVESALADLAAPGRGRAPDELASRLRIAGGGDDRGEAVHPGRPAVAVEVEVPDLGEGGRYLDRRLNLRHRSRAGSGRRAGSSSRGRERALRLGAPTARG